MNGCRQLPAPSPARPLPWKSVFVYHERFIQNAPRWSEGAVRQSGSGWSDLNSHLHHICWRLVRSPHCSLTASQNPSSRTAVIAFHRWLYELSPPGRLLPSWPELLNGLVAKAEWMEHSVGSTWEHLQEASIWEEKIILKKEIHSPLAEKSYSDIYWSHLQRYIVNNLTVKLKHQKVRKLHLLPLNVTFWHIYSYDIVIFRHYEENLHETWMSSNVNPSGLAKNKTL